jgi:hypothetical protein
MTSGTTPAYEYYHPPQVRVGDSLSRAITVLVGNFPAFILISALATLPAFAYQWAVLKNASTVNHLLGTALSFVLSALCEAMILYAAFQSLRGRPVRPLESMARGLQRFAPVAGASLLVGLATSLGMILLIVPGLIVMTITLVTLPACVVERLGPIESIQRSSELTRGHRWPLFGAMFAVAIVTLIFNAVIAAALRGPDLAIALFVAAFVWATLVQAYQTVLIAILYHDLRVVKDGIDLEHVAGIFD